MSPAHPSSPPDPRRTEPTGQLQRLIGVMARLRDPERGCAWDRAQDFASIAPYAIEEAYEVADAIARGDMTDLREELGDLQLQVVFHACMAEEAGIFTLGNVLAGIADKLERRHPHIFGRAGGTTPGWDAIKAAERAAKAGERPGALDGVALALPALSRAVALQKRAACTGFDWPDPAGARAKLIEEMAEIDAATDEAARAEEMGDLLFSAVNWARHLGIDPEAALRAANAKFEARFRAMEDMAGGDISGLTPAEQEVSWQRAKRGEA